MRLPELLYQISNPEGQQVAYGAGGAGQTILIILAIVIIALLVFKRTREPIVGICAAAVGLDTKKRENKEKILALLADKDSLSNSDIREAVGISERSVVRYMDELEREGRVEQVGNTGRGVLYRPK